ncbi:MAG: riboflavin kinase [Pirellula sp.]|nr:riboflavin kinase [Pirellula sp.]
MWISSGNSASRANASLVEPYRLIGKVEHGAGRGRTLGFPTANVGSIPILIPAHGVYAGRITRVIMPPNRCAIPKLTHFPTAVHIGPNPTFGENATKVESHVLGFSGDLYDATLEIELIARVRPVKKFANKEELLQQIQSDLRTVAQATSE